MTLFCTARPYFDWCSAASIKVQITTCLCHLDKDLSKYGLSLRNMSLISLFVPRSGIDLSLDHRGTHRAFIKDFIFIRTFFLCKYRSAEVFGYHF